MTDSYIYVITALLPLSACMLVFQVNPYHALVIRGILGAVAALVYAMFGAADVALTEALVGTMLAITLYAVAVRSSLTMRLGVIQDWEEVEADGESLAEGKTKPDFGELMDDLRTILSKHYMRLELVTYTDRETLHRALIEKEVHGTCTEDEGWLFEQDQRGLAQGATQKASPQDDQDQVGQEYETLPYHTQTRVQRLYEIMQSELSLSATSLTYLNVPEAGGDH
ncbi:MULTISPECIES: DUF4040 domain-containing protein [unclassified Moorena]|uniref:DUF4040 domain-containing protein n=1 Tax=unclassified Moorena TaxID=2683338 RepID=UPI0013CA9D54|nr:MULTISPECIES: DUF4040 domain-containing protein [unclassified Moorena]NEP34660.1 DUF4040 domain-containing protein [Moorena sp. SIO3B2]NES44821.1 DUF4040 domain-containing protein [Moorena sp. SIO2C4]